MIGARSPLPRWRAFVVQFSAEPVPGGRLGRVEHLASGEAGDFHSWDRLRAFVEETLARAAPPEGEA